MLRGTRPCPRTQYGVFRPNWYEGHLQSPGNPDASRLHSP